MPDKLLSPTPSISSLHDLKGVGTREVFESLVAAFPLSTALDCQQTVDSNFVFFQRCTPPCKAQHVSEVAIRTSYIDTDIFTFIPTVSAPKITTD